MWDFWKMVWQQDSKLIIMVCKLVDKGRQKCHQYYPDKAGLSIKSTDYEISCLSATALADNFIQREFQIVDLHTGKEKQVT